MVTKASEHSTEVRKEMRGGKGEVKLTAQMPKLPSNMRLFSTITLAPGCSIGVHEHKNETELFYFVSGSGRVFDNGVYCDVTAGDAMSTGNGESHGVENTGDTDLVMVAAIVLD